MNIALIGYRGAGKSSIGKALAQKLSMSFVDTDVLLVKRAGLSIREIFDLEGEPGFRARESHIIREVATGDYQVIALGGGAVINPDNIAAIKASGNAKVIWLQATPEVLFQRITADTATNANRPNLTSSGGLDEVQKLLAARAPLYQAAADFAYDVTNVTVDLAVADLVQLLRR